MKTLKDKEVLMVEYEDLQDIQDRLPTFLEKVYYPRRLRSFLDPMPRRVQPTIHPRPSQLLSAAAISNPKIN